MFWLTSKEVLTIIVFPFSIALLVLLVDKLVFKSKIIQWFVRPFIYIFRFLLNKFPYRCYNKNKYELSDLSIPVVTHYIKIWKIREYEWYTREIQDSYNKTEYYNQQQFDSVRECLSDVRLNIDFTQIDAYKEGRILFVSVNSESLQNSKKRNWKKYHK